MSEQTESEDPEETYDGEWELSDRDASEADALEQHELADPSDLDGEPAIRDVEAIGEVEASEADALDQARPVLLDDEE